MNNRAQIAKTNEIQRELFIKDMEQRILKFASKVSGRRITRSDDEWSIALVAFNRSIDTYTQGDYISYARKLMEKDLIDYRMSESRHSVEIPFDPEMLEGESPSVVLQIASRDVEEEYDELQRENSGIKGEIEEINDKLRKCGFSFFDMAGRTPRNENTRNECKRAVTFLKGNRTALASTINDGRLPVGMISVETGISAGLLEKYRKYIIMIAVICAGDYPLVAEYL